MLSATDVRWTVCRGRALVVTDRRSKCERFGAPVADANAPRAVSGRTEATVLTAFGHRLFKPGELRP